MLKPATEYKQELTTLFRGASRKDSYKFFGCSYGMRLPAPLQKYEFVSVDTNNQVLGYIDYIVNPNKNAALMFAAVSFTENTSAVFSRDLYRALNDIFETLQLDAVYFKLFSAHPLIKSYQRMIKRYGGKFIGYEKNMVQATDGQYYKVKQYKLTRTGWFNRKQQVRGANAK